MKTKYKCENCGEVLLPPAEVNRWDEERAEVKHAKRVYDHEEWRMARWHGKEYSIFYSVYVIKCPFCHAVLPTGVGDENDIEQVAEQSI